MVEGGSAIHTGFLSAGLVDEIHLAIAPIIVGDTAAPRFLNPANYPGAPDHRMQLLEVRAIGDTVLLRYAPQANNAG
jgi:5-amino-6-(5-phosphoribosylamino)uracil reductase